MNAQLKLTLAGVIALTPMISCKAQEKQIAPSATEQKATPNAELLSIRNEIKLAVQRGNKFLKSTQKEGGYWSEKNLPAFTSLAVYAAMGDPNLEKGEMPAHIKKGYKYILSNVHQDGGIYGKGLATYNTSIGIMALAASGDKAHIPVILKGRAFLINLQTNWKAGPDGKPNIMNGGIGYGGTYPHSDLSNTHLVLDALRKTDRFAKDGDANEQLELDWDAALSFVSSCQNLQSTNKHPDAGNDGSMVYFPGNSKAGKTKDANGKETLRGYGSMSYAGLLSLVHAELDEDDERVVAVKKWLTDNFSLEENPGLGQQGMYYYYHVMAKALSAAKVDTLKLKDGTVVDWRKDLASKLLQSQRENGSWVNKNSRWFESDPNLVTAYAILTLEQIYYSVPDTK